MPARAKPGNPSPGFPTFPPSLEIAARFPHSHTHDDSSYNQSGTQNRPRKLLPMSSDRSVTYVPGRTQLIRNCGVIVVLQIDRRADRRVEVTGRIQHTHVGVITAAFSGTYPAENRSGFTHSGFC
jgi:hypothetical protein